MTNVDPTCPAWSPPTRQRDFPVTPQEDAALNARFLQRPCRVEASGNHSCHFVYLAVEGDSEWKEAYRYYNTDSSYYYRGSTNHGFYWNPKKRRQHLSRYNSAGEPIGRENMPFEDNVPSAGSSGGASGLHADVGEETGVTETEEV